MLSLFKLCLLFVGLASAGTAIGIPLALKSQGKLGSTTISTQGGGTIPLSISDCKDITVEGKEAIDFGAVSSGNVCWKLEGESQVAEQSEEFSTFFLKQWGDKDQSWTTGRSHDKWKEACYSGNATLKWTITVSDDGQQYLGLCGDSGYDKTKFARKEKKHQEDEGKWTISVCSSECWEFGKEAGADPPTLNQGKEGSWKKVLFYGNKSIV